MVYFIRMKYWVKIGVTTNVEQRLAQIQTCCPEKCKLVALIEGDRETESALHYMFRKHRRQGEWFHYEGLTESCVHLLSQKKFSNLRDMEREVREYDLRRRANSYAKKGKHKLKNKITQLMAV